MTEGVHPDQVQHSVPSDLGLHRPVWPKMESRYGIDVFLTSPCCGYSLEEWTVNKLK